LGIFAIKSFLLNDKTALDWATRNNKQNLLNTNDLLLILLCQLPFANCPLLFASCPFAPCSLPLALCPLPFALCSLLFLNYLCDRIAHQPIAVSSNR
jgi:hypothetical protein